MQLQAGNEAESSDTEQTEPQTPQHLLVLSAAALQPGATAPRTMQLQVQIQGHSFLFLVDSGSSSCFIDSQRAQLLEGGEPLDSPVSVQVAGGAILQCTSSFSALNWSADGAQFTDTFRVLDLASYDGIVGLDWLGKYSPMVTHWEQGWLAF